MDALVRSDGDLVFTEVNARIGGSPHVYEVIYNKIVKRSGTPRIVTQHVTPATWRIRDTAHFLSIVCAGGLAYSAERRKGIIAAMPFAGEPYCGGLLFCVVYEDASENEEALSTLARLFQADQLNCVSGRGSEVVGHDAS